jgi:hypothetical protein
MTSTPVLYIPEVFFHRGRYEEAIAWAEDALRVRAGLK